MGNSCIKYLTSSKEKEAEEFQKNGDGEDDMVGYVQEDNFSISSVRCKKGRRKVTTEKDVFKYNSKHCFVEVVLEAKKRQTT